MRGLLARGVVWLLLRVLALSTLMHVRSRSRSGPSARPPAGVVPVLSMGQGCPMRSGWLGCFCCLKKNLLNWNKVLALFVPMGYIVSIGTLNVKGV